jgi:hypothetical protein
MSRNIGLWHRRRRMKTFIDIGRINIREVHLLGLNSGAAIARDGSAFGWPLSGLPLCRNLKREGIAFDLV